MWFKYSRLRKIKPHQLFILAGTLFGLIMIVVTPPFQVPDEINHWYRAFQISSGQLLAEKHDDRLGGYVPQSIVEITKPFLGLRWNMNAKTSSQTIKDAFDIDFKGDQIVFMDFPNTALYSPVSYFPQAMGILLGRTLSLGPLSIFYLARLMTLLIWVALIGYAIKTIPRYQWLLFLLALLPMSVFINMSLSADMVTNTISFVIIACILKFALDDSKFSSRRLLVVFLLGIGLASAKIVYTPLILLIFLVPEHKYESRGHQWFVYTFLLITGFGAAYFWSDLINNAYTSYADYNPAFRENLDLVKCGNIQEQMNFILTHDFYILKVFFKSLRHTFDMYYEGYVGTFGWLDTKMPGWSIFITYLVIIIASVFPTRAESRIGPSQKLTLLAITLMTVALVLLSQHLTWDCIGSDVIGTIQGRYFIPIFPLLFFCLRRNYIGSGWFIQGTIIVWTIFILCLSVIKLYQRYYVNPVFEEVTLTCSAESVYDQKYLKTSIPNIMLENADSRTKEKARSGTYSLRLDANNSYGFTYRFSNGQIGDIIRVSVWRLGENGSIVISGDSGNEFYLGSSTYSEVDSSGWKKLNMSYTLQNDMKGKEVGIYIFNNHEKHSYFDDLEIAILHQ